MAMTVRDEILFDLLKIEWAELADKAAKQGILPQKDLDRAVAMLVLLGLTDVAEKVRAHHGPPVSPSPVEEVFADEPKKKTR